MIGLRSQTLRSLIFKGKKNFSDEVISCQKRDWLEISSNIKQQGYEVNIMQYNVLAPCYTHVIHFPFCSKKDLEWQRRLDLIVNLNSLLLQQRNIICSAIHTLFTRNIIGKRFFISILIYAIQLKLNIFYQQDTLFDLKESLKGIFNFQVNYQQCIKTEKCEYFYFNKYQAVHRIKGKSKQDGCTTIFNTDEYEEVYSARLDLDLSNNIKEELRWVNCENICLFTLLKRKGTDDYILVGNTHFIYSPQLGIVKLGQAKLITSAIKSILDSESDKQIDVFLCGDFNFIPNSALYSFISEQSINFEGIPLLEVSNQKFAYLFEKNDKFTQQHFQKTTCKYQYFQKNKTIKEYIPQFKSLMGLKVTFIKSNNSFSISLDQNQYDSEETTIKSDINLKSAYAELYKKYHLQKPDCSKSLVNYLLQKIPKKEVMTFEYGLSHLTSQGYLQCDFIWYNFSEPKETKELKKILQLHDYSYVNSYKAFPNKDHPSDHFPIVATFVINN